MLSESCRSCMVRILAAIWRLVPPCSTAVHLLHALTTSSPVFPSVTHSFYYFTNISKFMRFYLISLACTSKLISPFPFSSFSLFPRHTKLRFTLATAILRTSPLSFFFFFSFLWSLFILSFYSFQYIVYIVRMRARVCVCVCVCTYFYILRKLESCLACTFFQEIYARSINLIARNVDRLYNTIFQNDIEEFYH